MPDDGLTVEQYMAQLKKLGLRRGSSETTNHWIYVTIDFDTISVPKPENMTPSQRQETMERIKRRLGIGVFRGN